MAERPDALVAAVAPLVAALGLDLYDLEVAGSGRARILRVLVDRPADGVGSGADLDAVTAAAEVLTPALDRLAESGPPAVAAALRGPYTLEVSSPGLERPLRTPEHFRRAVGATVSVKTRADGETYRRRGVLVTADDDGVELEVDGARERLAHRDITQARTVFEWGPRPKSSPRSARAKERSRA